MHALELVALGKLDCVERPPPIASAGELIVRTSATTICTSDVVDISSNPFGAPIPRVLGHEAAGVVVEAREPVADIRVGDSVSVHPVIPCLECDQCQRGLDHLCSNMGHLGLNWGGTFAQYFKIRSDRATVVPAALDPGVAALLEPVAVCRHALRRGLVVAGQRILVIGDGPFGLICSRLATALGAEVTIVGEHPFRLQRAHARDVVQVVGDGGSAVNRVRNNQFDAAILCVASNDAFQLAVDCLLPRGRLVLFSAFTEAASVKFINVHLKELEIIGACNDQEPLHQTAELLSDPHLALHELVTHRLPLTDYLAAFELAAKKKEQTIKVAFDLRTWA